MPRFLAGIGYAFAEPRFWESIPDGGWRSRLSYGYGLDVARAQNPHRLDTEITGDVMEYDFGSLPKFSLITCVSTLEHIGCDNSLYLESMGRRDGPIAAEAGAGKARCCPRPRGQASGLRAVWGVRRPWLVSRVRSRDGPGSVARGK
jgi:hypothetical protein